MFGGAGRGIVGLGVPGMVVLGAGTLGLGLVIVGPGVPGSVGLGAPAGGMPGVIGAPGGATPDVPTCAVTTPGTPRPHRAPAVPAPAPNMPARARATAFLSLMARSSRNDGRIPHYEQRSRMGHATSDLAQRRRRRPETGF